MRAAVTNVVLAAALLSRAGEAEESRVAAATIAPIGDLVSRVAGPGWTVKVLVPPGISPHVFEPKPADVTEVSRARLVAAVGVGYDDWVLRLAAAASSGAVLHDMGASIGLHSSVGPHGEEGVDPHWWLSPVAAARALAPLAERFAALDAAGAAGYRARAEETSRDLERLDAEIAARLLPVRGRGFVAAHAAWSWFASRYGIVSLGSIEPVPGREPSPRDLQELIHAVKSAHASTLFTEPQFSPSAARVIADEAGLVVRTVDPIGGVEGRLTYVTMMRWNAAVFRRGLAAKPAPRGGS